MKANSVVSAMAVLLMGFLLSSCSPSYIGFRTGPHFHHAPWVGGGAWGGPGVWGPRPFWGPRPWLGGHRPPVIINRNFYGVPRNGYQNRSYSSPRGGYRGGYGGSFGGNYGGGYNSGGYNSGYGSSRGPR